MIGSAKSLADLAELVGGRVVGDPEAIIEGVASIEDAGPGFITYLAHPRYRKHLPSCTATAVIVSDGFSVPAGLNLLKVKDPYHAFAKIHTLFNPPRRHEPGISPLAVIDPTAVVSSKATIHPHCYVGSDATVEEWTTLMPGVTVGSGARIGKNSLLYPNVSVAERCRIGDGVILHPGVVIGGDGFGYAGNGARRIKVPQVGIVEIANDVEIGANTTVDRATIGATRIGAGTKVDNLVQIGHNVVIGERCLIVAQAGIAGSVVVGDEVILAGQVGVVDHVHIGARSVIGPRSTVVQSVPPGSALSGMVAPSPHKQWLKVMRLLPKLPELWRRVSELEKSIRSLLSREDKGAP